VPPASSPPGDEDAALWAVAEAVCTSKQLEALRLHVAGYGARRSAKILGVSPQAVQARLDGAVRQMSARMSEHEEPEPRRVRGRASLTTVVRVRSEGRVRAPKLVSGSASLALSLRCRARAFRIVHLPPSSARLAGE
jgi:hypothetical protein